MYKYECKSSKTTKTHRHHDVTTNALMHPPKVNLQLKCYGFQDPYVPFAARDETFRKGTNVGNIDFITVKL